MTKEQAVQEIKELQKCTDYEASHVRADEILCELLKDQGFQDVVTEFEELGKWYA